jgi:hypothetical protein
MEEISQGQRLFLTRLAIGLAQGLALYLLYSAADDKAWPATQGLVFAPLLLAWLFAPVLLTLSLGAMPWRRAAMWAAAAALIIALLAFFDIWMAWPQDWTSGAHPHWEPHILPAPQLFFFGGGGLFIAHALVTGGHADRRFKARYPIHFDIAWKLAVQLALSAFFVGAFWLLLWLGAGLFKLIKLDFFERLIQHEWFAIPAITLATAGALHLTDVRPALVQGARTLLLTLLSWLLPLIALIVAGFVASLPFTGLAALWSFGHATALLLVASAALIVLINAAHQDGAAERMPPRILRLSGTVAAVLTVPLAAIAAYALLLRVRQYGWTVDRVTVAGIVTVALSYAAGYTRAALSSGPWLRRIESWNFYVSLLTLAILVVLFTPIASPVRISVADQMARLSSGKIAHEKFDYSYLRWHGGRYGQAALNELKQDKNAAVRRLAARALDETSWVSMQTTPDTLRDNVTVYPLGQKLPDSFFAVGREGTSDFDLPDCLNYSASDCSATMLDLDGDGIKEIVLISMKGYPKGAIFRDDGKGVWHAERVLDGLPSKCPALMNAFRAGKLSAIAPDLSWKDISIAGLRLRLRPVNGPPPPCPTP